MRRTLTEMEAERHPESPTLSEAVREQNRRRLLSRGSGFRPLRGCRRVVADFVTHSKRFDNP